MKKVYIFQDRISKKFVIIKDIAEAAELNHQVSIYTKTRQFKLFGEVDLEDYVNLLDLIRNKVREEIEKITSVETHDGKSVKVCTDEKRMNEIRQNEEIAYQKILEKLSQKAKPIILKRQFIHGDDRVQEAILGARRISI